MGVETLERPISKPGAKWREYRPILPPKDKNKSSEANTNLLLIERVDKLDLHVNRYPTWSNTLSTSLQILNNARATYQSLLTSSTKHHLLDHPRLNHAEVIRLANKYSKLKGSYCDESGKSQPLGNGAPYRKFEEIENELSSAFPSYKNILGYSRRSIRYILNEAKVNFNEGVEEFISEAAVDVARTLIIGKESLFPDLIKKRLEKILSESNISIPFREKPKKGTILQTVEKYVAKRYCAERIEKETKIPLFKVNRALKSLREKGIIPKLSKEKIKQESKERMILQSSDPEFKRRRLEALEKKRKEREELFGSYHTEKMKLDLSVKKGGTFTYANYYIKLGLSSYIISQRIEKPINDVQSAIYRTHKGKIPYDLPTESERRKEINMQKIRDKEIKNAFNIDPIKAMNKYFHYAQEMIFNILPKVYPTIELDFEERIEIAQKTAIVSIKDYDPDGKMGFHTHVIKRAVQKLTGCEEFLYLVK